jgi:hypothetical protein
MKGTGSTSQSASTTGSANRSGDASACPISASTTQFALKMDDGRTLLFDDVGNTRVRELVAKKNWAASGKPAKVKANGVLNGDRLTVMSVK